MKVATVPGRCPLCGPEFPREPVARGADFEYRVTDDQEFTVVRCGACGTWVLDPRPADDRIAALYPADYEPYRFDAMPAPVRAARTLVQRGKVRVVTRLARPGAWIVDFGCGGGAYLRLLREHGDPSWRLSGWDFPGAPLERLRADGFEVFDATVGAAAAPTGVDVFVLNQVIEHFAQPDVLVASLARALAPGGHLVLETPDTRGLDARLFRARHWGGHHFPRHLVLFDGPGLRTLVERAGLRVLETASLASPAFWVQSLHHALAESRLAPLARLCSLRNVPLVAAATALDLLSARFGPTSNQRLVAVKPPRALR